MRPSAPSLVNILVPVKRAIDYAVKIRIAKDGKGVDTTVKHSMVCSSKMMSRTDSRAD
jgi:electron transfer flavoprotein beta subunit